MTFAKKTLLLSALLIAFSFTAAAQDKVMKFTLSREARFGSATLAAGEYRMTIASDARMYAIVSAEDRHGASFIALPVSYGYSDSCTSDSLTLTPNGAGWDVTAVCFGESETALYFSRSAAKKAQVALQTTDATALAGAQ